MAKGTCWLWTAHCQPWLPAPSSGRGEDCWHVSRIILSGCLRQVSYLRPLNATGFSHPSVTEKQNVCTYFWIPSGGRPACSWEPCPTFWMSIVIFVFHFYCKFCLYYSHVDLSSVAGEQHFPKNTDVCTWTLSSGSGTPSVLSSHIIIGKSKN